MRSKPHFNCEAFNRGADQLRKVGWEVFNPAEIDTEAGDTPLKLSIEEQKEHASDHRNARRYAKRDCHVLISKLRAENGDAIVMLPDWQKSIGAKAEVAVARWVGLKVLTLEEAKEKKCE
jgi:hypothetical protein